ncbi:nuclear protein 96 domain-containing protein [Trichoderma barbatum]
MSFGGGFGGFGSNNQQQQSSGGFGGFGAASNTTPSGFGSNTGGGFGASATPSGGMFGNNSTATGGFGSTPGGFGSNTGGFGSKPAFGSTPTTTPASGGLFGGSSTPSSTGTGFGGGFGSTANTTTPSAFGSNTTGGGLFGNANKPAGGFGTATTGSSMFGGGNTNTTSNTGTGFGNFGATNTLGGATGDPPGTGITPFQAFTEKEPNSSTNQSNAFQSILFQEPYKKWSADELRLADYVQGRRHGNPSGAGAFGVGSGFGGPFGANNQANTTTTGGFGTTSNTGGLFGTNTPSNNTTSGFGGFGAQNTPASNTAGGLFGGNANKPSGGLFGNTPQQNQTGGMFGSGTAATGTTGFGSTTNTAGGLFGSASNTTANTSGGLFGNAAQKPAGSGFSFGNTANTPSTGFGTTNNAFGATPNTATGGGLFGNTNANPQASGGLFGNTPQPQQNASGGLFGQAQPQQPGGLFGNQQKPATGGLFGSTPAATNTGGLFGGNTIQQQGTAGLGGTAAATGGLFGNKPATGGGIFGSSTVAQGNTVGGGLFGGANAQTQQATGTGLFGSAANQQKPGLFGSTPSATGGGMFGNPTAGVQGGIFSNAGSQQQQSIGLGGSLLGASQQVNNAPQGLTANLSDVSAYGSPSLFSGVSGGEVPNPGPLAVPLSGQPKPKRPSIFPMYKFTPAASGRFGTPQKRGFGFSYSSYGTPGGASPAGLTGTPSSLGRSLLGATSSGTSLTKSISSSNLRRTVNADDSILLPGAFSNTNNTRWYGSTGSKKLVINRELRSDLFSTPQKDRLNSDNGTGPRKLSKRVSFDTNVDGEDSSPVRALPAPGDVPETPGEDTPRSDKSTPTTNGLRTPEMEQFKGKGKELAIVQEEDSATPEPQANGFDNAPGKYWMEPSREELQNMNRIQRQRIDNFTVGRENVGSITFKIPVDISAIDLDELCGGIIQLEPRSATVYPIAAKKPPVGKGLNVPARISLEQSWPRGGRDKRVASDPKRFNKHIERLKRIVDTTFENYDVDTGVWTFSVEHFTTYGLDDSDDETDFDTTLDLPAAAPLSSVAPPVAPTSFRDDDMMDFSQSHMLPGAFDNHEGLFTTQHTGQQSFLGVSSADSATHDVKLSLENEMTGDDIAEYDMSEDEDMTRSSIGQHLAAEHDDVSSEGGQDTKRSTATPGGILRARMRAMKDSVGPVKLEVADGDDWMEMLRKTVSPMKRDRHLLKEMAGSSGKQGGKTVTFDLDDDEPDFRKSSIWGRSMARPDRKNGPAANAQVGMDQGRGFATSIDLMNSLFEKPKPKPARQQFNASQSAKGFPKFPYERQTKVLTAEEDERAFHSSSRPTWGPDETLVLIRSLDGSHSRRSIRDTSDILTFQRSSIQTDEQDIRIATFTAEPSKKYLHSQDVVTEIRLVEGVPQASLHTTSLKGLYHHKNMNDAASIHEKQVWELASILFDNLDGPGSVDEHLVRRNKLSQFWSDLVDQASSTAIGLAATSEEKALACLAGHRIPEACKHLLDGKNFRLATLVPLIGTSDVAKREMREQVKSWLDSKILSEFSEAVRTIYELLSGNVCVCEGLKGVPNEDRVDSFVISKNFGFDWRQSFGLRLWYAISNHDDLSAAVEKFKDDIDQDKEDLPRPWYVEQGIAPLWDDANIDTRQDLLWGLLQLYADQDADLEAVLRPENSQLSPLDARLRWQLGIALTSTGKVSYGTNGIEKADAATLAFAAQLTRAGEWLEAAFVLLHLHHTAAREKALQEHLCQHADLIGSESDANFAMLTEKYRIPAAWIWEALALYMRCVKKDAVAEMQCLLRAGSHVEAHRILVQHVAPQAIIERDYAGLSSLITQFQDRQQGITEWTQGGEIYGHFLQLIDCRGRGESASPALLDRLLAGLNAMKVIGAESNITRYAAISDMADETAREIVKLTRQKQDMELRSRILSLPLTQDRLLAYSVDLSLDRYREVMSH